MKKYIALLIAVAMLVSLAACGGGDTTTTTAAPAETTTTAAGGDETTTAAAGGDEQYTFGYTCMTMNNPFFIILEKSIRDKVEANGDTLITTDPAMDVTKQINQVEDMITQGIDAIFLNPVDWEGIRPALEA